MKIGSPLPHASRDRAVIAALAMSVILGIASPEGASAFSTELVAGQLNRPVYAVGFDYPGVGELLYIVEQRGIVHVLVDNGPPSVFLNIDSIVHNVSGNGEQGLLGLAFHPDFVNNDEFFVHYSDNGGTTRVARYTLDGGNPLDADVSSGEIIFSQSQPFSNHNGGWMSFGPNGYLWLSLGDGGSGGDPGNRAQTGSNLLGKILRIDVDVPSGYGIPSDNPFVGNADFLDEIWSYGLRNAWRCSFDRQTNDLWIGDVGQSLFEEINFEPANAILTGNGGRNYGWRLLEGCDCFNPPSNCDPTGMTTLPLWEYCHSSDDCPETGFSVTGGYVYRGSVGSLYGLYIFADFFTRIWSLEITGPDPECRDNVLVTDRTADFDPPNGTIGSVSSFGEDANGELLIVDRGSTTTGEVWRVVLDPADVSNDPVQGARLRLDLKSRNPFSERVHFSVTTDRENALDVRVISAAGRGIRNLSPRGLSSSGYSLVWDRNDESGRPVPSGVYFIRASLPGQIVSQRVELLR